MPPGQEAGKALGKGCFSRRESGAGHGSPGRSRRGKARPGQRCPAPSAPSRTRGALRARRAQSAESAPTPGAPTHPERGTTPSQTPGGSGAEGRKRGPQVMLGRHRGAPLPPAERLQRSPAAPSPRPLCSHPGPARPPEAPHGMRGPPSFPRSSRRAPLLPPSLPRWCSAGRGAHLEDGVAGRGLEQHQHRCGGSARAAPGTLNHARAARRNRNGQAAAAEVSARGERKRRGRRPSVGPRATWRGRTRALAAGSSLLSDKAAGAREGPVCPLLPRVPQLAAGSATADRRRGCSPAVLEALFPERIPKEG